MWVGLVGSVGLVRAEWGRELSAFPMGNTETVGPESGGHGQKQAGDGGGSRSHLTLYNGRKCGSMTRTCRPSGQDQTG